MWRSGFGRGVLITGAAVLTSAFLLTNAGVAGAANTLSFTVSTAVDGHDASPGDGLCADAQARCTLRAAIEETNAQAASTSVTVTVPAGIYKLTLGTLPVTRNTITISGANAATTIVLQNGLGAVVSIGSGARATLAQLTLTNGGPGAKGGGLYNSGTATLSGVTVTANTAAAGAGITNAPHATLTLASTTVSNNSVASVPDSFPGGSAGGIENAGKLSLWGSVVSGNYAGEGGLGLNNSGGVGGNGGGIVNTGTLLAVGSQITGNYAGTGGPGNQEVPGNGGNGGGLYSAAGVVVLISTTVSGNFAGQAGAPETGDGPANAGNGGGIFNSARLAVSNSTFSSNTGASGGLGSDGGGIYNVGTSTIASSTFTGNVAGIGNATRSGYGGAIANIGTLILKNSSLTGNAAGTGGSAGNGLPGGNGGGLYQGGGAATLTGDTLSGNTSGNGGAGTFCEPCFSYGGPGGTGGGIYSTATLSITNSTLSGNTVGVGGNNAPPLGGSGPPGIGGALATGGGSTNLAYVTIGDNSDGIDAIAGTVTLAGTIVADSTGANDQTPNNCTGTITETTGYNLDSGTTCNFSLATDISGQEPLLGSLAANGGPTETQALPSGSPAIDTGGSSTTGCPLTDQRGSPRPDETADGGTCDIGAYESQGVA